MGARSGDFSPASVPSLVRERKKERHAEITETKKTETERQRKSEKAL